MPQCMVDIQPKQYRALRRKLKKTGMGSISIEIRKALDLYLAGDRSIEAAFEQLLVKKMPKDFPILLARFNEKIKAIRRTMKEVRGGRNKTDKLAKRSLLRQIQKSRGFSRSGEFKRQMELAKKAMVKYRKSLGTLAK